MLDEEVLVALGTAYSTLWKYHWRCVIDTEPWIAKHGSSGSWLTTFFSFVFGKCSSWHLDLACT
ncbi:hypothetical protein BD408DRAFT_137522 [Parasitella parasitica]|nr:hypothetical protein BD408DRAFT_137522 [Parasitella parasitica]